MQRLALIFAVFVFSVAATLSPASAQSSDGMVQVEDIVIEGNRRVAESTIRSYLPVQVGDRVTQGALGIAATVVWLIFSGYRYRTGWRLQVTVPENQSSTG